MISKSDAITLQKNTSRAAEAALHSYSTEEIVNKMEETLRESRADYSEIDDSYSKRDIIASSFGLSYAVSALYLEQEDDLCKDNHNFFRKRAGDFEEFIENSIKEDLKLTEYIQMYRLYKNIAELEDIELNPERDQHILTYEIDGAREQVNEILEGVSEGLNEQDIKLLADD